MDSESKVSACKKDDFLTFKKADFSTPETMSESGEHATGSKSADLINHTEIVEISKTLASLQTQLKMLKSSID